MGTKGLFRRLTILVLSDANHRVKRFHIHAAVILALSAAIAAAIAGLAAAAHHYSRGFLHALENNAQMREEWLAERNLKEKEIREKNAEIARLQDEILRLTQEVQAVAAKVSELKTLEREILQLTGNELGETGGGEAAALPTALTAQGAAGTQAAALLSPVKISSSGTGGIYFPTDTNAPLELSASTLKSLEDLSAEADRLGVSLMLALEEAEQLAYLRSITPSIYPTTSTRITSSFGYRKDPFTKRRAHHNGIDFGGRTGDPVFATANGTVKTAGYDRAAGNYIVIRHGNGIETVYMHLSKILVKKGQNVKKGEQIGTLGSTGRSTGPHLHYEVHKNGVPVNPKLYIQDLKG